MARHSRILIVILMVVLTACTGTFNRTATNSPPPAAGKSSIAARIISTVTNKPLANTMIRLAPVNRNLIGNEPIFLLNETSSPGARTDAEGNVLIANVDPQEYVMIVSSDIGDNAVVTESPDKAKIWQLEKDKVLEVGEIRVKFP